MVFQDMHSRGQGRLRVKITDIPVNIWRSRLCRSNKTHIMQQYKYHTVRRITFLAIPALVRLLAKLQEESKTF